MCIQQVRDSWVIGKGKVLIENDSKIANKRRVRYGRSEICRTKVGRIG